MSHWAYWWSKIWACCSQLLLWWRQIVFWICCNFMYLSWLKTVVCSMFWLLAFKAEFFLNNFSLAESTFNILSFFHAKNETEIVIIIKMLAIEQATWVIDVLKADRAFSFVNQTSACMQMSTNSFKSMIYLLSIARWRSELILCCRLFSRVSLLYFNSALNRWNFIQKSWKKILF